jgi:hypothetical protein
MDLRSCSTPGTRWALAGILATALVAAGAAAPGRLPDRVEWASPIDVASGPAVQGPWRQNESDFDFVDDPTVALYADGTAAVAWVDQRRKDVLFQAYDASGRPRLAEPVNVSRSPRVFSWLPRIVLSPRHPDDVYILWQEIVFSGGSHGGDIFFSRSTDGGRRFSAPVNLSNSMAGDGKARISRAFWHNGSLDIGAAPDGTLYAAWTEYEGRLWFTRSTDRGAAFSKPLLVAGGDTETPARAPSLAAGPHGEVYLAWTVGEDDQADIRVIASNDGGRTFGEPVIVARTAGYSDAPRLALGADGTLHVVNGESEGGPFDRHHVRYTRSRDGGRSFEPGREISRPLPAGIASASFPAMHVDGKDRVSVLWELSPDARNRPRGLGFAYSVDGGATFQPAQSVPGSSGPPGAHNGSRQGLLTRKLAANDNGAIAVVNSNFRPGKESRVWLLRGSHSASP